MQGAAYLGYRLVSRTTEQVQVEVHGVLTTYDVFATLEFTSDRKRMSVIVRAPQADDNSDRKLLLMCKGADTIIMKRVEAQEPERDVVTGHLVGAAAAARRP